MLLVAVRLQRQIAEWRIENLERMNAELERRIQDLIIANQNQATVIVEICHRLSALERGNVLGINSALLARHTPQFTYYPRGYGP